MLVFGPAIEFSFVFGGISFPEREHEQDSPACQACQYDNGQDSERTPGCEVPHLSELIKDAALNPAPAIPDAAATDRMIV